jgi:magnesium-protoporphyrin IX monomethyl ester (oxidative) cyclase
MRHGEPIPEEFQHRRTQNMNTLPYPDYSDYFALEELYADFYKDNTFFELNVIILEGSRGCWWGAKNPCTFCGLNGHVRVYREKNSERFAEEICSLSDKWQQVKYINFSDSILSQRHMKELPELLTRKLTRKIIFMTEIKSNISEKELFGLAVAGFHSIQPGIESLNDDILRIMNKGNNALNHIALLRYARKFHVNTIWNFLHAFPGEPATAYEESEKLLPLLYHLQPPNIFGRIQYQRSSVYCNEPEKYGLDLRPNHVYDYVMPNDEDYINGLAYNFEDHAEKPLPEVYSRMTNLINKWRYQWQRKARERLEMELFNEMGGSIEIRDTRMCSTNIYHTLIGIKNLIYRDADIPISRKALEKKYGEAASAAIDELIVDKLMIEMKGKVLALAVETTWKSKRKSSWLSKISDRKLSDSCSS